jgi:hypothetical protein
MARNYMLMGHFFSKYLRNALVVQGYFDSFGDHNAD